MDWDTDIEIPADHRDKHVYIAGKSGYGKTTLIQAHIRQDMLAGQGLCFIDPNGDSVDEMLNWVPPERVNDCILFDSRFPLAIDFLSYEDKLERSDLVNDIVNIFDLEGAKRAKPLLIQLLGTLLDARDAKFPVSFLDIGNFIRFKKRRDAILDAVPHRKTLYQDFKLNEYYDTILSRMIRFDETESLRSTFSDHDPINILDVMQNQKILFIRLRYSELDYFIGALILSKIQQAAMRRAKTARVPFYLYVDEFENIQAGLKSASFQPILKQARKFNLCLTIANQVVGELDDSLRRTILGTVSTFIIFRIHDDDCKYFSSMAPFDEEGYRNPQLLAEIPKFHAMFKIGDMDAEIGLAPEPPPEPSRYHAEIAQTITNRAKDRHNRQPKQNMLWLEDDGESGNTTENQRTLLPDRTKSKHPRKSR
jgi:hypothetical protein